MTNLDACSQPAVPLTVLTGFLGAGKTTLLRRLLTADHGLRIAVLVNDFGALNIDADLVVDVTSNVVSLANGCVCCTIRGDLLEAMEDVLARPERPQYVILEASGVADPSGIVMTFHNPALRDRVRLDSIICVLDAEQVFLSPDQMRLKLQQIAFSDLLLLNKVDLVDAAQIAKVKNWLDEYFHRYRLLEASHCELPMEVLLAAGRFDAAGLRDQTSPLDHDAAACDDPTCTQEHGHEHDHSHQFGTWSFSTHKPMSLEVLRTIAARLPNSIYRCKGIIYSRQEPNRRFVLQVVGKRVDISAENLWGDEIPATRIVAIGARVALDRDLLRTQFETCLMQEPAVF